MPRTLSLLEVRRKSFLNLIEHKKLYRMVYYSFEGDHAIIIRNDIKLLHQNIVIFRTFCYSQASPMLGIRCCVVVYAVSTVYKETLDEHIY